MIGMRLGERDRDVTNMKEEIKVHLDNMKQILAFLDKSEKNLPKEGVPADKKEADKQLRQIKQVLDQLYENQPLLDETKVGIRDLLKRNPNAPGSEHLDHALNQVVGRWKELQDKCKARINLLDELKDFHDINDSLNNWLNSKARMMNVLGPISSDPRLIQNQMSQIAVMREDFNEKAPTRDRFNEIGDFLLENTGDGPDGRRIEDKLDTTNKKWDDLLAALEERERALNDLAGPTRDFLNLTNQLTENLGKISDDLDDVATSKADPEQKMNVLQNISGNLDNQRPLLSDVASLGGKLQDILTDPASKSEIKSKLGQVERQFNNCRKKLDNALAELENSAREGKEFAAACADVQDMLREFEQLLSDKLAISADKDTLKHQVSEFDPLYQEIMSKEHEVIMLINRGRDIVSRAKKSDAKSQQKTLDDIEKQWQKVKKTAQDRQKRLSTAMEHCKKYGSNASKFVPWLEKAEATLAKMAPIAFVKADLQKQEKELSAFRNDVNRHTSEYDGTNSSGGTFIDACDTDKDIVKEELAILKERWDQLNFIIAERGQAIQDILAKLGDFNDDVRDTNNGLNRVEEKLHGLDKAPRDAKTLDAIKGLLDDTKGLEKLFGKVQKEGEDLINDADQLGSDSRNIADTVNNLGDRLGHLKDALEGKADDLKNAGAAVGEFTDKVKGLSGAIGALDDEFNKFGPIARDLDTLHKQMDEVHDFIGKVAQFRQDVDGLAREAEDIIRQGFAPNAREMKDTVSNLAKQLDKLDGKGHTREKEVDNMINKVSAFYDQYNRVMNDIENVIKEEKGFGAVGGDSQAIKAQQEQFKVIL